MLLTRHSLITCLKDRLSSSSQSTDCFEHPPTSCACFEERSSLSLGMKIKKSLLASAVVMCVAASSSGALQASNETYPYPTPAAGPVTTTTVPRTTATKTFVWSSQTVTAGSKLKLSKIVSVKVKGKTSYRASGACSLRKGVLSFNRTGKCRISVSVKLKSTGKVLRSSKVFTVTTQAPTPPPSTSGMPNPIGCIKASKHPLTGRSYPATSPGYYELQTGWTCDSATLDARPLLEYFKAQGWILKSTTAGDVAADLAKGSSRASYEPLFDGMPEGQTFLILTIY